MTTSTPDVSRPVRLPRRSRQGVVLGMDPWQLAFLAAAGITVLIAINRFGPVGLLFTAPIYLALGGAAITTVHGISAPRIAGLWMLKHLRHGMGATTYTFRPEQPKLTGTLNLPGTRASLQLWETDSIACVYNPHDRSVSVTAELEVQGFLMHDTPERFDLAQQWSRVLASFTQRAGIKRVTLQERTIPTTIRAAREHYDTVVDRRHLDPHSTVAANYAEVMNRSERFAITHRNYLTFTLDLIALAPQLKSLGGGKDAIIDLARIEAGNLADALQSARVKVRRWLSSRDIAALSRLAMDPESAANVQNRPDTRPVWTPRGWDRCTWRNRKAGTGSCTPTVECTPPCGSTNGPARTRRSGSYPRWCSPATPTQARPSPTSSPSSSPPSPSPKH
jgi:hypothetical protein